jgi:hypothetical protein
MSDANFINIKKISNEIESDYNTSKVLREKFKKLRNQMIKDGYGFGVEYAIDQNDGRTVMKKGGIKIVDGFCPNDSYFDEFLYWDFHRKMNYDNDVSDLIDSNPDCSTDKKKRQNSEKCNKIRGYIRNELTKTWLDDAVFGYLQESRKNQGVDNIKINDEELQNLAKMLKKQQIMVYKKLGKIKRSNPELIIEKIQGEEIL